MPVHEEHQCRFFFYVDSTHRRAQADGIVEILDLDRCRIVRIALNIDDDSIEHISFDSARSTQCGGAGTTFPIIGDESLPAFDQR